MPGVVVRITLRMHAFCTREDVAAQVTRPLLIVHLHVTSRNDLPANFSILCPDHKGASGNDREHARTRSYVFTWCMWAQSVRFAVCMHGQVSQRRHLVS